MRGEPEHREYEVGTLLRDALLFWVVVWEPQAAGVAVDVSCVLAADFDFLK